jgi:prepilin-type N-terminal cleavage/methylation domain-containing protein
MDNFALIRTFWRSRRSKVLPKLPQNQAGYTLLELLVTLGLLTAIIAIAAPSWLGFVQQRRVSSANDAVLRALQDAQSKAKTQKLPYSVSFRTQNGVPQVAVYPGGSATTPSNNSWKQLGEQLSLQPGQIWIGTNVARTQSNTATGSVDPIDQNGVKVVTFDNSGALPTTINTNLGTQGLIIVVGAALRNSNQVIPSTRRCVKISTLLGSIQTGKLDSTGAACNPI